MRVCGVLAPVPAGHRWFELLSERLDTAEELHDLLVALAALREAGCDVGLVAGQGAPADLLAGVSDFGPDLVVLAASSARWPTAVALAPPLAVLAGAPVRLVGGHCRRFPRHALLSAPGADQAVVDGVDALVEAVNRARLGHGAHGVAGVADRLGPAAPRARYDGPLPSPEWGLLKGERPLEGVATVVGVRLGATPGPHGGTPASPEAAARSLQRAARLRPAGGIVALDPCIADDPEWFTRLTGYLARHNDPVSWSCQLPPRAVTPKVTGRLGPAGCTTVTLTLGTLGARGTEGVPAQLAAATHALRGAGIGVRCDLVIGGPDGSPRADREAIRVARRHVAPSEAWPRLFRPDPGTPPWVAERWTAEGWVTGQLEPTRAMYLPRGYGAREEVEALWRKACLRAMVDLPRRLEAPLRSALKRLPAPPEKRDPR